MSAAIPIPIWIIVVRIVDGQIGVHGELALVVLFLVLLVGGGRVVWVRRFIVWWSERWTVGFVVCFRGLAP